MSELLDSLTKIENVVSNISTSADERKSELSAKYKKLTLDFDARLKEETDKKLSSLKEEFEVDILEIKARIQREADDELIRLNNFYSTKHKDVVQKLFNKIIEVDDE